MDQQPNTPPQPKNDSWSKKVAPIVIFIGIIAITVTIVQLVSLGIDALRAHWQIPISETDELSAKIASTTVALNETNDRLQDYLKTVSPYEYKDQMQKSAVVTNFENSAKNNKYTALFERDLKVNGKFKRGFLYVRASVNGSALTKSDGVYTKIGGMVGKQYVELGGHLIKSKTLDVPQSEKYTEYLFELTDVKTKNTYADPDYLVSSEDWLDLLNSGSMRLISTFSSTQRSGKIEELSIYYECLEQNACSIQ